jgi:hypothetical protein
LHFPATRRKMMVIITSPPPNNNNTDCGSFNGYTLYKDNEGCYYNGANYSKVYVDASIAPAIN